MLNRCKICFNPIYNHHLSNNKTLICDHCFQQFDVRFIRTRIETYSALIIYHYNDFFKTLLYMFKGCFDYELKDVFLDRFKNELKLRYYSYYIVFAPSNFADDEKRGYNHVQEIALIISNKVVDCLYKNQYFKQSDRSKQERNKVKDQISIKPHPSFFNKKILLVDDVITTGSTIKRCVELLKKDHPKKIEILILSKNFKNNDE